MAPMTNAEALRLAVEAKTRVMRGGVRAATMVSTCEVIAMARVLDSLFVDLDRDVPSASARSVATPISDL